MGIFGNAVSLNNTNGPSGAGYYYLPGVYESEITAVKKIKTRSKGEMVVVETLILESSNPDRPVGGRPSWTQLLEGKAIDVAPMNIKMFLTAAAGLNIFDQKDAKTIAAFDWDSFGDTALSEDNPLKGCRVHIEVVNTKNKAGGDFSKHTFTPAKNLSDFQKKMLETARKAASK